MKTLFFSHPPGNSQAGHREFRCELVSASTPKLCGSLPLVNGKEELSGEKESIVHITSRTCNLLGWLLFILLLTLPHSARAGTRTVRVGIPVGTAGARYARKLAVAPESPRKVADPGGDLEQACPDSGQRRCLHLY